MLVACRPGTQQVIRRWGLMSNSALVFDPEDDSEQTGACVFVGRPSSPAKIHRWLIKFSSHLCSRCCSPSKWASFSRCLNTKQKAFVLRLSNCLQTNTRKCIISYFALTGTHLAPQRDIRTAEELIRESCWNAVLQDRETLFNTDVSSSAQAVISKTFN